MKMNYSHKQLTKISNKSLWIIMDPVEDQEIDIANVKRKVIRFS